MLSQSVTNLYANQEVTHLKLEKFGMYIKHVNEQFDTNPNRTFRNYWFKRYNDDL